MSLNRVTIIGNIGSDPDIKPTAEGLVCTFSVATNEYNGAGMNQTQTEWHYIVTFGKLAQNCSRYLKKGSHVFLEGRLRTFSYRDKEDHQQVRTRINAVNVQFLDRRDADADSNLTIEATESGYLLEHRGAE